MQIIDAKQFDDYFNKLCANLNKGLFKIEVLQDYSPIDDCPSLRAFLKGNKENGLKLLKQEAEEEEPWLTTKSEIEKVRVHVVELPFSPYMEWEIEWYELFNIPKVGEQVFLIDSQKVKEKGITLPAGDILIFDDKIVSENEYDETGDYLGSRVYDQPEEIQSFLKLKEELFKMAIPLEKFLKIS